MVGSFLAPKWPIMIPFCGMHHQKSTILLISDTLSVGGCWGQPMLLFWKLVDETQMPTTPEATNHHSSRKLSILLPLRAIQNHSFHYETPCKLYLSWEISAIHFLKIKFQHWYSTLEQTTTKKFKINLLKEMLHLWISVAMVLLHIRGVTACPIKGWNCPKDWPTFSWGQCH